MDTKPVLYSISYGCPKMDRSHDCPLLEIEHLAFKEKIKWINELSKEKEELILSHHSLCTKRKSSR